MANFDDDDDILDFLAELDPNVPLTLPKKKPCFRPRINFDLTGPDFKERFRLCLTQAQLLLQQIGSLIAPVAERNHASSAKMKLLTALRFYGTNPTYYMTGDCHGAFR